MRNVSLTSIKFINFKAFADFSIALKNVNILVGLNNHGKSTIISALRALAIAWKKANSRNALLINYREYIYGHYIDLDKLPLSIENLRTDYNDEETQVIFRFSNNNKIRLIFPIDGGCLLTFDVESAYPVTPANFRKAFPFNLGIVPVLGPLEYQEKLINKDTVERDLATHRASRHFRSYWYYNKENFDDFADLLAKSWPNSQIKRPEFNAGQNQMTMFYSENRIDREIYWSGFGFQIWCQLLTHITREKDSSLLVIDEPETYLHPTVQRQLIDIIRSLNTDIILATHSSEIIAEAEPSDILSIDKTKKSAKRLNDMSDVQDALDTIGSIQNITLTKLARNKKLLFREGDADLKIIRFFAKKLDYSEIAMGEGFTTVASGGFNSWESIKSFAWGVNKALDKTLKVGAFFDRDYWCEEELQSIKSEAEKHMNEVIFLERKEIENYLIIPKILDVCLQRRLGNKYCQGWFFDKFYEIINNMKSYIQSQYMAKKTAYFRNSGKDQSTLNKEAIDLFETDWGNPEELLKILPGKKILQAIRNEVQKEYSITLTDSTILACFTKQDIPDDMHSLLQSLEKFRTQ